MGLSNESWLSRVSNDQWYFGALLTSGMKIAFHSARFLPSDTDWVVFELLSDTDEQWKGYFTSPTGEERPYMQVRYQDVIAVWELAYT